MSGGDEATACRDRPNQKRGAAIFPDVIPLSDKSSVPFPASACTPDLEVIMSML